MKISEETLDQFFGAAKCEDLLKKRDHHRDLAQLHSGPYGLRIYREYHEEMVEKITQEIKKRTQKEG